MREKKFSGTDPRNVANSQTSIFAKKQEVVIALQISFAVLFEWELRPKSNFIAIFSPLADFTASLYCTKENADMRKIDV